MPNHHSTISSILAVVMIAAAGCANTGAESSGTEAIEVGDGWRQPNGVGLSLLSARALINRDGTADFETTTGSFDQATEGDGSIAALSLNVLDESGGVVQQYSYSPSTADSYFGTQVENLHRGQPFNVLAQVLVPGSSVPRQGIGQGIAKYRPDVAAFGEGTNVGGIIAPERDNPFGIIAPERGWASLLPRGLGGIIAPEHGIIAPERGIIAPERGIIAPERVGRNTPVQISTNLVELKGDVTGLVDCELYVNNRLVATSTDIEVPAGGSATCEFQHSFATMGITWVRVVAANVRPSDYDTRNNYTDDVVIVTP
jgi:hypothetical protein